jgi:hypothetical protein
MFDQLYMRACQVSSLQQILDLVAPPAPKRQKLQAMKAQSKKRPREEDAGLFDDKEQFMYDCVSRRDPEIMAMCSRRNDLPAE